MTTATMTLTEFLLARIAEDEVEAKIRVETRHAMALAERSAFGQSHMVVGGAFDPARVLAECEAKRQAIDAAWRDHERIESEWGSGQSRDEMDAKGDVPEVVVILTAIYCDHPDYRDEWRA